MEVEESVIGCGECDSGGTGWKKRGCHPGKALLQSLERGYDLCTLKFLTSASSQADDNPVTI
jgi:hypothetical protein